MSARRLVAYDDIATSVPAQQVNGTAKGKKKGTSDMSNGTTGIAATSDAASTSGLPVGQSDSKRQHWSEDGRPISASAARRYRRVLQLLSAGQIQEAQELLERMETASRNVEIVEAVAWAKRRASMAPKDTADGSEVAAADGDDGDDDDEDGDDLSREEDGEGDEEYDEATDDAMQNGGGIQIGTAIDWQGSLGAGAVDSTNEKPLTHAEIWDDSALIDAWDAAMEEYKLFDAQRAAYRLEQMQDRNEAAPAASATSTPSESGLPALKRSLADANDDARPAKRSALWHDSPPAGSPAALEARAAAALAKQVAESEKRELSRRKSEARSLLAQIASQDDVQLAPHTEQSSQVTSSSSSLPGTKKRKIKGVVPPSSHVQGNPAWLSACAIVSQTPNEIGEQATSGADDMDGLTNETRASSAIHPVASYDTGETAEQGPQSATDGSEENEVLQNLAMAWYYAGYYQAMASAHFAKQ